MRTMKIGRNDAGQRLDKFLAKAVGAARLPDGNSSAQRKSKSTGHGRSSPSCSARGTKSSSSSRTSSSVPPRRTKVRWARSVPNWISCMRTSIFCCSTSAPACWFTMTPQAAKTR